MIRHISARVDILRDGVRCGSLPFPQSSPPSVMADSASAIKTSLAGVFLHTGEIDYLNDELQPVLIIDGVETPSACLCLARSQRPQKATARTSTAWRPMTAASSCSRPRPRRCCTGPRVRNTSTRSSQLLVSAGIGMVMETPSALTLATDREDWAIGTPYLTIINTLLAEINYNDIWFDPARHSRAPAAPGAQRRAYCAHIHGRDAAVGAYA